MKKILKAVIAAILAVSMLFGAVSASAVSFVPAVSGNDDTGVSEFDFVPDKTGYYKSENHIYFNEDFAEYIPCGSDDDFSGLYYMESGKTYVYYDGSAPEFIDTAIDSISVTDSAAINNLILGVDAKEGDTSFYLDACIGIVFANGETVYTTAAPFICESGIAAGENEVEFDIPAYDGESMTVTAHALDDVIKSVKLKNSSSQTTAYVDYTGTVFFTDSGDPVVVINDTQEIVVNEYNCFVYSSRMYYIFVERETSEATAAKIKFYISGNAGAAEIASYKCNVYNASARQNMDRALYYFNEDIQSLVQELVDKYTSKPFLVPFMMLEYWVRAVPLAVEAFNTALSFI